MNNESHIQKHLAEQTIMFASITKWIFLSSLIGALVGVVVSLFLKLLTYCENSRSLLPFDYYYTLPFALVITVFIVKKFAHVLKVMVQKKL